MDVQNQAKKKEQNILYVQPGLITCVFISFLSLCKRSVVKLFKESKRSESNSVFLLIAPAAENILNACSAKIVYFKYTV